MKPRVHPCLWFADQAEEAARFYLSVFPNSGITAITRYGPGGPMPEGLVLTISFELDGVLHTALNGGPLFTHSPALSLVVSCQTQTEIDHYWQALSAVPEAEQCGWLQDRYGVSWQIVPEPMMDLLSGPDNAGKQSMTAALMKMRKLDLAALLHAYHHP